MELTGAFWQDARNEGRNEGRKEGKKAGIKIGERRGKKQGIDEAIIKLISDLFALSNDRQAVIKILMNKMNLSQEQAEGYYKRATTKVAGFTSICNKSVAPQAVWGAFLVG